jgi:segregation and condensation protein B
MEISISAQIESILFWKGEPMSFKEIAKILNLDEAIVRDNSVILQSELENRGIVLINSGEKLSLATHAQMSEKIAVLLKEELSRDLSKANIETLSIILYRGAVTRSEIDYIRGVNSQFILRALSIRGLVDRETDPKDERAYLYKPSIELLSHLGITDREKLPDFEKITSDISNFMNQGKSDTISDDNKIEEE